jgi:hypothetical protein
MRQSKNSLCADSASVRPSFIFPISNSIHPDLAKKERKIKTVAVDKKNIQPRQLNKIHGGEEKLFFE